ncbi:MAG: hypothetical protein HPY78_09475 [Brevinematales bacterium]|nr:hypothetical protein [Brevinematales bacterium]
MKWFNVRFLKYKKGRSIYFKEDITGKEERVLSGKTDFVWVVLGVLYEGFCNLIFIFIISFIIYGMIPSAFYVMVPIAVFQLSTKSFYSFFFMLFAMFMNSLVLWFVLYINYILYALFYKGGFSIHRAFEKIKLIIKYRKSKEYVRFILDNEPYKFYDLLRK